MKSKLLLAAAIAALSLGAGVAQAQPATDSAIAEAKVSFYFGYYGYPYGGYYYNPYYTPYYYGPKCYWSYGYKYCY
ncbi:MAG: hypothetical protein ACREIP_00725 [Alphaproteobacteria bacterium]